LDKKWLEKKQAMTPRTPNFKLKRVIEGEGVLNAVEQILYRCGVGILLYLVKHTRPDLANAIRELSKAMDIGNYVHWKELLKVILFALQTKQKGLVLKPDKSATLQLKIYVDAEFAGDADNRRSIMGRVLYLNNTPIGWNSKAMSGVTLSSTEAEYVSMSEGMKDLKFLYMCLRYLQMRVDLPMLVFIDNIGAIEMLESKNGKCRTKHVDTRYHWIREYILDEMVKVMYVKSEDNVADICTKNLQGKLYDKHSNALVHDVAFLAQCLTQRMGREEDTDTFFTRFNLRTEKLFPRLNMEIEKATKRKNRWNLPETWELPLGEFKVREIGWLKRLYWIGCHSRIDRLKKTIQGPLQAGYHRGWGDCTGTRILHDEEKNKRVIMNFRNSRGYWRTIYDTDYEKEVDQWYDDYHQAIDTRTMMIAIENVKGTNKRNHDEFIEMLYEPWKKLKQEN